MNINKIDGSANSTVFTGKRINLSPKPKSKLTQIFDSVFVSKKTESFTSMMKKYSNHQFANVSEMQEGFANLFNAVEHDKKIKKAPAFSAVNTLFQKGGFLGLLYELWKPNPGEKVKRLVESTKDNSGLVLASKDDKPVLSLINHGPYGFFNYINENYDAKRHMTLSFNNPESANSKVEFFMDKSGQLTFVNETRAVRYYKTTGTPKTETIKGDRVEIIHYNEDGSKAFFKNLFFGGTQGPDDLVI